MSTRPNTANQCAQLAAHMPPRVSLLRLPTPSAPGACRRRALLRPDVSVLPGRSQTSRGPDGGGVPPRCRHRRCGRATASTHVPEVRGRARAGYAAHAQTRCVRAAPPRTASAGRRCSPSQNIATHASNDSIVALSAATCLRRVWRSTYAATALIVLVNLEVGMANYACAEASESEVLFILATSLARYSVRTNIVSSPLCTTSP